MYKSRNQILSVFKIYLLVSGLTAEIIFDSTEIWLISQQIKTHLIVP